MRVPNPRLTTLTKLRDAKAPEYTALWRAIDAYAVACGGSPKHDTMARADAKITVYHTLKALIAKIKSEAKKGKRPPGERQ